MTTREQRAEKLADEIFVLIDSEGEWSPSKSKGVQAILAALTKEAELRDQDWRMSLDIVKSWKPKELGDNR